MDFRRIAVGWEKTVEQEKKKIHVPNLLEDEDTARCVEAWVGRERGRGEGYRQNFFLFYNWPNYRSLV